MRLLQTRTPFNHPEFLFEIKHDGFRGLALIQGSKTKIVSRNMNEFSSFSELSDWLGANVEVDDAILDGEIVCLARDGRAVFDDLLFRRKEPYFYAFDCLWLAGRDLRHLPLIERKGLLSETVPRQPSRLLYVDHVMECGVDLFRAACDMDLEGIVAKLASAPYGTEPPTWVKIKNPTYSQAAGRRERFERMRTMRATASR